MRIPKERFEGCWLIFILIEQIKQVGWLGVGGQLEVKPQSKWSAAHLVDPAPGFSLLN